VSNIVFMAPVTDPGVGTTKYGAGHSGSFTDEVWIRGLIAEGKAAYQSTAVPRNPRVTALGTTTATITWEVDGVCTSTRVESGTTTAYGTNTAGSPATGNGTVSANLTGLTTATTYNYRIQVVTAAGTTYTTNYTFRTN
jgi:hypothetical protein